MSDAKPTREWMPHVWEGFALPAWIRQLVRHRFAVSPKYWYVAVIVSIVSTIHWTIWVIQEVLYRHRFVRTPLPRDPIFILGHWRSGTTLLHELMILDPRHTFPTSYQCFEPNHFWITEKFFTKYMQFLVPTQRPMDNMPVGWDRPQEDEFALCLLGQPSPYDHIGYPNQAFRNIDALDFRGWDRRQKRSWSRALAEYLRRVTFVKPGRLVLKSPPHSARIATLIEHFPDAKFVHIVRNPYEVYPSTKRMWKSLYRYHEMHTPNFERFDDFVIESGRRLYDALEEGKKALPPGRFAELRYEDLIADPLGQIERLYRLLDLGDFLNVKPHLEPLAESMKGFKRHRQPPDPADIERARKDWGDIIERYGYGRAELATPAAEAATTSPLVHPLPSSTL